MSRYKGLCFTVCITKDRALQPDTTQGTSSAANFGSGDLGVYGTCAGNALYYHWTTSSTVNSIESG
jgi:hypothetical protein